MKARAIVRSMVMPRGRAIFLAAVALAALAGGFAVIASRIGAEEAARATRVETADEKRWQAVAPGRVEPSSGEIKIAAPVVAVIGEVLVKPNDRVFAGEPLVRLTDHEAQARRATAEAQVALRRRARNDEAASSRAAARRRAEDAAADADKAVAEAQAAADKAAIELRAGRGSDASLETARSALSRAQERLRQQKAELRRIEADNNTPLPSQNEGQLNIARAELLAAEAAIGKLIAEETDILSDDTLVDLLKEQGFDLARRTVAKYREAMGIGSSIQRRRQRAISGKAA